ncbi:MAG TPA: aminotransferase class III-fold pyridoxal phosphate-dependent enzyme, partial [Phycisphaerae bacterium]|nr:aminotransferase class III-fold pyridoxal phosphate-dependent enzyme [Phycisphaerae bacterium]
GNPICAAAALASAELIEEENLVQAAIDNGRETLEILTNAKLPGVMEIRGKGMMLGIAFDKNVKAAAAAAAALDRGLLTCTGKNNTLRFVPALNIDGNTLHKGLELLIAAIKSI